MQEIFGALHRPVENLRVSGGFGASASVSMRSQSGSSADINSSRCNHAHLLGEALSAVDRIPSEEFQPAVAH